MTSKTEMHMQESDEKHHILAFEYESSFNVKFNVGTSVVFWIWQIKKKNKTNQKKTIHTVFRISFLLYYRVLKCDVIKFSFLHFSIFMTIFH